MSVKITGQTFRYKHEIKSLGGRWNNDGQHWEFYNPSAATIEKLNAMVGCTVVKDDRKQPEPFKPFFEPEQHQDSDPHTSHRKTKIIGDDQTYFNHFKDKNPATFFGFSNLNAMMKYVENVPEIYQTEGWLNGDKWDGSKNMPEAFQIARDGWSEGVKKAHQIVDTLRVEHAVNRKRSYSVAGSSVNVGRLLSGNPTHMLKKKKQHGSKVVTVFVEIVASAFVKADVLIVKAATIAALCDLLEQNDYRCEIVSLTTVSDKGLNKPAISQIACTVKSAGDKMNLDDVMFALGHPSYFRRFNFACVSSRPELRNIWSTQGYPTDAFNSKYPTAKNEIYIKKTERNIETDNLIDAAHEMLQIIKPDGFEIGVN